jgi:short-chain fatty acids transporter
MSASNEGLMARAALLSAAWSERWFPDAWVFAALGVVIVAIAALAFGATPTVAVNAFGDGFWSLIPFTMQMVFVVIGGYVVATTPIVARLIEQLARVPRTGRGAICYVGLVSMLASLLSWSFSLVFGGLLVRALARREDLRMDYRAAGAAAYLGLGAVWAMGLSSSAAQLRQSQKHAARLAQHHRRAAFQSDDFPMAIDPADDRVNRRVVAGLLAHGAIGSECTYGAGFRRHRYRHTGITTTSAPRRMA